MHSSGCLSLYEADAREDQRIGRRRVSSKRQAITAVGTGGSTNVGTPPAPTPAEKNWTPIIATDNRSNEGVLMSALPLPAQPVDATQALNFSAGVSNPRVLRGRSLSWRATLLRWACEYTDKSAPFGKYCLSRPLVFSLEPRCHGLCGSQK